VFYINIFFNTDKKEKNIWWYRDILNWKWRYDLDRLLI